MAIEFKLPELGENVETGDVVRVFVKAGDSIAADQPVVELETESLTDVPPILSDHIRNLEGIQSTTSLVAFPGASG